jgi:hypothetical protein
MAHAGGVLNIARGYITHSHDHKTECKATRFWVVYHTVYALNTYDHHIIGARVSNSPGHTTIIYDLTFVVCAGIWSFANG